MVKTLQDDRPDWWDEYDDYLLEKSEEDYEITMALKPQRDLDEQIVLDELFPNESEINL